MVRSFVCGASRRNWVDLLLEALLIITYLAFRARCKFWQPSFSDAEGRKWWEAESRHS